MEVTCSYHVTESREQFRGKEPCVPNVLNSLECFHIFMYTLTCWDVASTIVLIAHFSVWKYFLLHYFMHICSSQNIFPHISLYFLHISCICHLINISCDSCICYMMFRKLYILLKMKIQNKLHRSFLHAVANQFYRKHAWYYRYNNEIKYLKQDPVKSESESLKEPKFHK